MPGAWPEDRCWLDFQPDDESWRGRRGLNPGSRFPSAGEPLDCASSDRLGSGGLGSRCGGRTASQNGVGASSAWLLRLAEFPSDLSFSEYSEAAPRKGGSDEQPNGLVNRDHRTGWVKGNTYFVSKHRKRILKHKNEQNFPGSSSRKESAREAGDPGSIPGSGSSPGEGVSYPPQRSWVSLMAQTVKNLPAMQETWVQSLGWEDAREEGMATCSIILAWRIPWTEKPGGVQSLGLQRVLQDCGTKHSAAQSRNNP